MLFRPTSAEFRQFPPHWLPCVDVAIVPFSVDPAVVDFVCIPSAIILTDKMLQSHRGIQPAVGVGDELFIVGLFTFQYGQKRTDHAPRSACLIGSSVSGRPAELVIIRKRGLFF